MVAAHVEKRRIAETLVARLDHMTKREPVVPRGQQAQERRHILALELAPCRQHPQQRPKLVPKHAHPLPEKLPDPLAGIG